MNDLSAERFEPVDEQRERRRVRHERGTEQDRGTQVQTFDLARLEKHSECISCFACKLPPNEGICVFKDGLAPVLAAIREADGLVISTPNYLGDATAEFKALLERLVFQHLTYRREPRFYDSRRIPVLFVMTSNAPVDTYDDFGYDAMVERYKGTLETMVDFRSQPNTLS